MGARRARGRTGLGRGDCFKRLRREVDHDAVQRSGSVADAWGVCCFWILDVLML